MCVDSVAILYSTGCPKCKVLKKKLDKMGWRYIENNSVDEMLKLGITEVPVLSIGGKMYSFAQATKIISIHDQRGLE